MGVEHPFGQTRISASEYENLIGTAEAIECLEACDVSESATRLRSFANNVPELLLWLEDHGREYPWRETKDPWKIYATELLLQRTRADAVANIYDSFFASFPTPEAVWDATDERIFEEVQSLGFGNQRTRCLREAAQLCVEECGGEVPDDLELLQQPWRAGPYSARACLLFAFDIPLALVDANTARIIDRVFDYEMPAQPHKSSEVYAFMETLIPDEAPLARAINFALLDLGALICTEQNPQCSACPLNSCCFFAQRLSNEDQ